MGIGLPERLIEAFLQEEQHAYDPHQAQQIRVVMGVSRVATLRQELEHEGKVLGYELLGYEESLAHSWLCSGLDREMYTVFGIRPNQHGLIDSLDEAMQVYDWIAEDEQQGHRAEPEPYYPWLLVEYPLHNIEP
jgi:hypothetical protein